MPWTDQSATAENGDWPVARLDDPEGPLAVSPPAVVERTVSDALAGSEPDTIEPVKNDVAICPDCHLQIPCYCD